MFWQKIDLHTHTCLCDGADSPEEMARTALEKGMQILGFSGHSGMPFPTDWCMTEEGTKQYRSRIDALKEQYRGQLRILCGIEQDFYAAMNAYGYDYIIGSVHYLYVDGEFLPVDESRERFVQAVKEHFQGDYYRFIKAYYETVARVADKTECDIVGHFDLVNKFNRGECLFSESDYRYRRAALDALDVLLEKDMIFEINTGAIARGYLDTPYPSSYFLRRIAEKRGRVMLNSDAHCKENLMFGFADAVRFAKSCGVGGLTVPAPNGGWEIHPINVWY